MISPKRAVIFVNGRLRSPKRLVALLYADDFHIAADGGLRHLRRLDLKPHLLIGDLDSVTGQDVQWASANGAEVRRYPREKDETDLELAIQFVINLDCQSIRSGSTMVTLPKKVAIGQSNA